MEEVTRREAINKLAATAGVGALFAAATAEAKAAVDPYHHEAKCSELHAEWGIVQKPNVGEITVKFRRAFSELPIVLLTPWWDGQGSEVSHVDTLTEVTHHEFKVVSNNAADNYYVSWLAIGRRRG